VQEAVSKIMEARRERVARGELQPRTRAEVAASCRKRPAADRLALELAAKLREAADKIEAGGAQD
jgi:hypothetical protein